MPNIKSIKAKGRRLQNYVRDQLRTMFVKEWEKLPRLKEDDIKSQTMGMTGEDIVLSPAAKQLIRRAQFGTEGAVFAGLIGGTIHGVKSLANKTNRLEKNNSALDRFFRKFKSWI